MTPAIGIVDYGMGNLKSLANALAHLGVSHSFVSQPADLPAYSHVIIPGVGAYARAMANLAGCGFVPALQAHRSAGRPLLGICLGMQLLSSSGSEPGQVAGLDFIPGEVVHLPESPAQPTPHVGWNGVAYQREHPVFQNLKRTVDFYFVHSYHFQPRHEADALARTDYAGGFCSIVARDNVVGVQFHPEKSQEQGLRLLENFSTWDGRC